MLSATSQEAWHFCCCSSCGMECTALKKAVLHSMPFQWKLFATTIPFAASSSQFATVKLPSSCSSSLPASLTSSAILLTNSPETPRFQQNESPYRRRRRRSILGASSSSFFSSWSPVLRYVAVPCWLLIGNGVCLSWGHNKLIDQSSSLHCQRMAYKTDSLFSNTSQIVQTARILLSKNTHQKILQIIYLSSLPECGIIYFVALLLVMNTRGFLMHFLHFSGVKWSLLSYKFQWFLTLLSGNKETLDPSKRMQVPKDHAHITPAQNQRKPKNSVKNANAKRCFKYLQHKRNQRKTYRKNPPDSNLLCAKPWVNTSLETKNSWW